MAEGASSGGRGRGGARKRDYKQLDALLQLAEGRGDAAAAPCSVRYVRADSPLVTAGKLEGCGVALLLRQALAAPGRAVSCAVAVVAAAGPAPPAGVDELPASGLQLPDGAGIEERKEGSDSGSGIEQAVARSTAATFKVQLPGGVQMRVTVGNLRRARRYTPASGAGRVAAVVSGRRPNGVQLQLAGSLAPTDGTRPPLKFDPPLQLVQQRGATLCPPAKRPRNSSNDSMCSSDDEGQGGSSAGGGTTKPVHKKQAVSVGRLPSGATTLELSFGGPSVNVEATQDRLDSSGAAVADWWDAPSDALPYVLHFEALGGLQKQGGGQLSQAELQQLGNQFRLWQQHGTSAGGAAAAAPAALFAAIPRAGAAQDPVALLSVQVQNLTVQQTAVQQQLATQGATLLQHGCFLQQHGQVLRRHETGIMANCAGLLAQQDWNDQTDMRLVHLELSSQLADARAWAAAPASQQQPTGGPGGLDSGGLELEEPLAEPGSPRSFQQLRDELVDAVPGGPQLPPLQHAPPLPPLLPPPPQQQPQQAAAGEVSLESQVRQALLQHGLSACERRTRSQVAAAVRPHLPRPLHLPTVVACIKLVPELLDALCAAGVARSEPSPAPPLDTTADSAHFWLALAPPAAGTAP